MANRQIYKTFVDMPLGVQNFLLRDVESFYEKMIADYKLPDDKFFESFDAPILDSIMGIASFDQSMGKVGEFLSQIKLEPEKQQQVLTQLLQHVYWPLREMFAKELTDFVAKQKIDTAGWPQQRILFKPISYNGAVTEVINRLGLHSAGQQARDRLRDLFISLVKEVRVPDQAKQVMLRASEAGGLGFDEAMAVQALAVMDELIKNVKVMDEQELTDYIAAEMNQDKGPMTKDQGLKAQDQGLKTKDQAEADEQIATIKASLPPPPKAVTELDKDVTAIWERIPNKPQDEYLGNRLRNVISSRLRDVRNSSELLALLERDSKVGGLGLEKAAAEDWSKIIEAGYEEFRTKIETEERGKLDLQLTEQKRKIEEKRRKEAEEHAKWYEEKIKKKQSAEQERQQLAQALKKGLESKAVHPLDVKNAVLEKKQFGELVPAAGVITPTAIAKPQMSKMPNQFPAAGSPGSSAGPQVKSQMLKTVPPERAPEIKTVKISAVTAEMAKQDKTVRVDGVKPVAKVKLLGLIEELGGMTLSGFRRLGKTPQEAVSMVRRQIDTLSNESFEHKVSGIKAWQGSPLMKMYMGLVAQSFKVGQPIIEIAKAERAAGRDTLSSDEVEALIQLNNQLHF